MKPNKLLFYLRRLYLRYTAILPRDIPDSEILKKGHKLWSVYSQNNKTGIELENLWTFQNFVLKLRSDEVYCLQKHLCDHYLKISNDYIEHDTKTENAMYNAYKNKIYAYKCAIY